MKRNHPKLALIFFTALGLAPLAPLHGGEVPKATESAAPAGWKPVDSTQSGLLLQPPLDLSQFTREEFAAVSGTVGPEKIRKPWTSAVSARPDVHGLTESEVKDYMREVHRLFDQGAANPVSDVGLISTQEDVIRRPMYNHIAAFSNQTARVYLLVQHPAGEKDWHYFSIVQDLTTEPPTDYFGRFKGREDREVKFEGTSCYKCHSSGPLAIHPVRADLVSDAALAAALSGFIADQPRSRFHFPPDDPPSDYGKPLALKACTKCHDPDGDRAPLFKVQAHPIRVLVDYGYMPPKRRLTPGELAELKAWFEQKP